MQFIRNVDERYYPDIRIKLWNNVFYVNITFLISDAWNLIYGAQRGTYSIDDVKGFFLIDEEGIIWTDEVELGEASGHQASAKISIVKPENYDRLQRFLDRWAVAHDLDYDSKIDQRF
eukprot:CAMPEP_0170181942 /NCGR_PEP_ID=MMETSP0040_2-20121228/26474_1 /TAXON_ID=641309 /ORGANISM="Lotharella oceanica, Strain CCMP622" /LENGTH=117 /DNA_ID=CAMNT_0010427165 /DNA_START=196 /DNA_END=549 /DNA_ORIENTATION=+